MTERIRLNDRKVEQLKPQQQRVLYYDSVVPGLAVSVTPSGAKSFVLYTRFPGSKSPARRSLGRVGALNVDAARAKARSWLEQISEGKDPQEELNRRRKADEDRRRVTFAIVAEEYLRRHVRRQRNAYDVERGLRYDVLPKWGDKPITEISRRDVIDLIEGIVERGKNYQAGNVFSYVRGLFNWVVRRDTYGLDVSPCHLLRAGDMGVHKKPRQRVLNDEELLAFWRAAAKMPQPWGPMFQFLLITGQRRSEVSDARWREFHPALVRLLRERKPDEQIDWAAVDNAVKVWQVPPERFKSDVSHLVPLSDDACRILEKLPHFKRGDHLFTTTFGVKPVRGFSKAKLRLDQYIEAELKELAHERGEDGRTLKLEPFIIHDLRRSMRTRLSSLRIPTEVAELVIGHAKQGLARVYDQHHYADEMREALEAWAARLRSIVDPAPDGGNVVALRQEGVA